MLTRHRLVAALTPCVLVLAACRDVMPAAPDQGTPKIVDVDLGAEPEPSRPWRVAGRLVGTTDTRAIVLSDNVVSVEISTGASVSAATAAQDPQPSFDRLLPRLGDKDPESVEVDRLADLPVYVGGGVVVFMRGTEAALTSLVGLEATTLEEKWVLALSEELPVKSCATEIGVLIVPRDGEPARIVDWSGQQKWLRELADPQESIESVICAGKHVEVKVRGPKKPRTVTYDAESGDLRDGAQNAAQLDATWDPRVRQSDGVVERVVRP